MVQKSAEKKRKNFKHLLIIQTHELGHRYDKGAIQRDRTIGRRLTTAAAAKDYMQVIGTAAAALVGADRYSNSNSPRAVELNAYW